MGLVPIKGQEIQFHKMTLDSIRDYDIPFHKKEVDLIRENEIHFFCALSDSCCSHSSIIVLEVFTNVMFKR